jgi:hypothetical protein
MTHVNLLNVEETHVCGICWLLLIELRERGHIKGVVPHLVDEGLSIL